MSTSKRHDLLVVGAGIIGLSAAYHIKEAHPDLSVLIIDKHAAPGQGDTAKSVAAIRDTFTSNVNRTLSRSSIDFYKHVQLELGFNLNLDLVGYLWLLNKEEVKAYEAIEAEMRGQGMRLKTFERNELSQLIPDLILDPSTEQSKLMGLQNVEKGVQGVDCGTIAPELIVKYYDTELRNRGVEFLFGAEAQAIHLGAKESLGLPGEPFLWQDKMIKEVETNLGTFSAETYLIAAGIGTPRLLDPIGVDCMIKPRKNQVFQLRGSSLNRLLATKGFNELNTTPFTVLPGGRIYFRPVPKERSIWAASAPGLGAPAAGRARYWSTFFLQMWDVEFMLATVAPFLHLSLYKNNRMRLKLHAPAGASPSRRFLLELRQADLPGLHDPDAGGDALSGVLAPAHAGDAHARHGDRATGDVRADRDQRHRVPRRGRPDPERRGLGERRLSEGALLGGSEYPLLAGQGVARGQWWRLVSSGFLHENILHIRFKRGSCTTSA